MKKWLVVISDVVKSRKIANREQFQEKLRTVLHSINESSPSLISPYTITLGDEFQAVYEKADGLFADLWRIRRTIHPEKYRVSLAIGGIDTRIEKSISIGMDGPAFHAARDGILKLKKESLPIGLSGITGDDDGIINDSLNLIFQNGETWNRNRLLIQEGLLRNISIDRIAEELLISRTAVYKNLTTGSLRLTTDIQLKIERMLGKALNG